MTDISQQGLDQLRKYEADVVSLYNAQFDREAHRFRDARSLLNRFGKAVGEMLSNRRSLISSVDEAHNELCVASCLLRNTAIRFETLEYEPRLTHTEQSIDFKAGAEDGLQLFVDIKTIAPRPVDRWDQYEKIVENNRLPENVHVHLNQHSLGGELWHNMYAARERMLEHALGLEKKIRDGQLAQDGTFFILMLCGNEFDWRQSTLEDFTEFYRSCRHRSDDPFAVIESYCVAQRDLVFEKSIGHLACLQRPQFELRERSVNWNVRPPTFVED